MILRLQPRAKKLNWRKDQRGVTLLLAILVLSAVTAIVFSVAAIAVNETRVSGDLLKTDPAITAAEAGTEDLLYYAVRGVGSYSSDCSAPSTSTLNGVTLSLCANPYLSNPVQITIPPNSEKDLFLYNPLVQGGAPGYTNLALTLVSGVVVTGDLCSWTSQNCKTAPDIVSGTVTTGNTGSIALNPNQPNGYQLILVNTNTTSDVVNIVTAPTGLPSGTVTLEATGSNNGVTRKIQTILPQ